MTSVVGYDLENRFNCLPEAPPLGASTINPWIIEPHGVQDTLLIK